MESEALVQLALEALSCSQKELAIHLGVSPTQISKWKKDEHMSSEMEAKLRSLANIGDMDPRFVVWSGSLDAAKKWSKLIHHLAACAKEEEDTGYDTYPLEDDMGLLPWHTFHLLQQMGVQIPKEFPKELAVGTDGESQSDDLWDAISANPHASLIYSIFKSLNDVYGFYAAYVSELVFDNELDLYGEVGADIDSCLIELAAAKLEEEPAIAPNFARFKRETMRKYEKWLDVVKLAAFRAGVPLRAELLDMVYQPAGVLGHKAEAESLGFNKGRLHPDVYMNELLEGMRVIHQVLPAILKKLGIEDEFQIDASELRLDT